MMCFFRYFLCALIGALNIGGCVSSSPYPDNWPKLQAAVDSRCLDLTGSFENYGRRDNGERIELAYIFLFQQGNKETLDYLEALAVSHVSIDDRGNDGVVLKAWVGEEFLMERQLTASQLPCREGRLVYDDSSWDLGGIPGVLPILAHSSIDRLISLSADGSLVMENKELSVGAALIVPLAEKARTWFRFKRISPDSLGIKTEVNSPHGVRSDFLPSYSLRPPEGAASLSGRKDAEACINQVKALKNSSFYPEAARVLGGRSTQAFIVQVGRDGSLQPSGRIADWDTWRPATHELRIEKQHWQLPSLTDNYVVCMLRKGYRWD